MSRRWISTLYVGILNFSDVHLNVVLTADPFSVTPLTRDQSVCPTRQQPRGR